MISWTLDLKHVYLPIALELRTLPRRPIGASDGAAVIVIDGTWSQAKSIFNQSRALGSVRQVMVFCVFVV